MPGAARKPSAIAYSVGRNSGNVIPKECRTFDSDLKMYVEAVNKCFYPDVSVACRPVTTAGN
jgi:hypothetical protein